MTTIINPGGGMMMMGRKCHGKVFALPPCSYSSRQVTSSISIPFNNRNIHLSLGTAPFITTHPFSSSFNSHTYCTAASSNSQQEAAAAAAADYDNKNDFFAAEKQTSVVYSTNKPSHRRNFVDVLSKILASLLSYGVVFTFITIAACFYTPHSAFADSCGRMGGSSSSSYSSHTSSSSSDHSDSYDHYDYSNSSRRLTFICTCDSNCTNCNCNFKEKDNNEQETDNTCSCDCHKSCYFHKKIKPCNLFFVYIYVIGTVIAMIVSEWEETPVVQPTGTMLFFQVRVSDKERILQRKLNNIAEVADTSTLNGLNYVLKEVVKALIQQNESSFNFSNLSIEYDSMESLSKRFLNILNIERDKYDKDEETFVNVDGVKYKKKTSMVKANSDMENEYTVATVLVLATGKHLIPSSNSVAVLQTLKCIPKNEIQSVQVLWSPQKEDGVLLKEEPGRDYPLLIQSGKGGRIYMQ